MQTGGEDLTASQLHNALFITHEESRWDVSHKDRYSYPACIEDPEDTSLVII